MYVCVGVGGGKGQVTPPPLPPNPFLGTCYKESCFSWLTPANKSQMRGQSCLWIISVIAILIKGPGLEKRIKVITDNLITQIKTETPPRI